MPIKIIGTNSKISSLQAPGNAKVPAGANSNNATKLAPKISLKNALKKSLI